MYEDDVKGARYMLQYTYTTNNNTNDHNSNWNCSRWCVFSCIYGFIYYLSFHSISKTGVIVIWLSRAVFKTFNFSSTCSSYLSCASNNSC